LTLARDAARRDDEFGERGSSLRACADHQQTLHPERETDASDVGTAELADEPIITAAAPARVLGADGRGADLERRPTIIIETANHVGARLGTHTGAPYQFEHGLEMRCAVRAERFNHRRRGVADPDTVGPFAVEKPKRVVLQSAPAVLAELRSMA